jgi:hypothetical protein
MQRAEGRSFKRAAIFHTAFRPDMHLGRELKGGWLRKCIKASQIFSKAFEVLRNLNKTVPSASIMKAAAWGSFKRAAILNSHCVS